MGGTRSFLVNVGWNVKWNNDRFYSSGPFKTTSTRYETIMLSKYMSTNINRNINPKTSKQQLTNVVHT
jgi:hypothetical protein